MHVLDVEFVVVVVAVCYLFIFSILIFEFFIFGLVIVLICDRFCLCSCLDYRWFVIDWLVEFWFCTF